MFLKNISGETQYRVDTGVDGEKNVLNNQVVQVSYTMGLWLLGEIPRRFKVETPSGGSSNDLGYFPTLDDLETLFPVADKGNFATVGQEPDGPAVFYNWDDSTEEWIFSGEMNSYTGLSDTLDNDYVGKSGYSPKVNNTEDGLELQKDPQYKQESFVLTSTNVSNNYIDLISIPDGSNELSVYLNGLRWEEGEDYTISDNRITFVTTVYIDDDMDVIYYVNV